MSRNEMECAAPVVEHVVETLLARAQFHAATMALVHAGRLPGTYSFGRLQAGLDRLAPHDFLREGEIICAVAPKSAASDGQGTGTRLIVTPPGSQASP